MEITLLIISLLILVFLVFRNVPIFFASMFAALFCLITAQFFSTDVNFLNGMLSTAAIADPSAGKSFISGLSGYFGNFFWLFILGALFGKIYEVSGAAKAVANGIVDKFGEKAIIPAILAAGFLLTYGGVSVFVCLFALYPLIVSMFKRANISRTLVPLMYFAGAGTASAWIPGSPQIQNTIPADVLGTPYTGAFMPSILAATIQTVITVAFVYYWVNRSRKLGFVFEEIEDDKAVEDTNQKLPNFLIAIVPMAILLVTLNFTTIGASAALAVGVIAAMICLLSYIDWPNIWKILSVGLMGGVTALFNTASVVGFGTVVQSTPAFAGIIETVSEMSGDPLTISIVAVGLMAAICGSGSGALGIALPIIGEYFVPLMNPMQIEALARGSALSSLTLDSLPHNGLVVTVLNYTGNSHKQSYLPVGVVTVVIPAFTLIILMVLFRVFGYA